MFWSGLTQLSVDSANLSLSQVYYTCRLTVEMTVHDTQVN